MLLSLLLLDLSSIPFPSNIHFINFASATVDAFPEVL
jgi:hypothetical protein